jgi:hypothetical protein
MELRQFQRVNSYIFKQRRIENALVVVSSFNNDLSWLPRYSDNYLVYEQGSGSGIPPQLAKERVQFVKHCGANFSDYFSFVIENYETLPETVYLIKGNIFPRHVSQSKFDALIQTDPPFSFVDPKAHQPHFPLGFFNSAGLYYEFNSDWFSNTKVPRKYFDTVNGMLQFLDPDSKRRLYSRFSIGAQYVTTREIIRKLPKAAYVKLLNIVTHDGRATGYTLESYLMERVLEHLWYNSMQRQGSWQNSIGPLDKSRCNSSLNPRKILAVVFSIVARFNKVVAFGRELVAGFRNRCKLLKNWLLVR